MYFIKLWIIDECLAMSESECYSVSIPNCVCLWETYWIECLSLSHCVFDLTESMSWCECCWRSVCVFRCNSCPCVKISVWVNEMFDSFKTWWIKVRPWLRRLWLLRCLRRKYDWTFSKFKLAIVIVRSTVDLWIGSFENEPLESRGTISNLLLTTLVKRLRFCETVLKMQVQS